MIYPNGQTPDLFYYNKYLPYLYVIAVKIIDGAEIVNSKAKTMGNII